MTVLSLLVAVLAVGCDRARQAEHDPAAEHGAHAAEGGEEHHGEHEDDDPEHAGEAGGDHHAEEPGRVHLEGVRGVAFAAVGAPIEEGVWRPGEAMADERERAVLSAPASGVVAAIHVPPGREVGAGTPLVTLRSPELAGLTAALLSRRALREQAAAELAREERLQAAGAGAARELEAARAGLAVAAAEEEAARLALEARGVEPGEAGATLAIRAPKRGRVAAYRVLAGAGVESGEELGTFETGRATLVAIELPLPGPTGWAPGAGTIVRRGDGVLWEARVEGLPTSVSPDTRRLSYRLRLARGEPPFAGTPLEVRVPLPPGIVVPQDALQQIEGEWGVFVADGGEAAFTPVRRGPELGGDVVVLDGLAPGQRIATSGAYLLKALVLKQTGTGDGHAH
jgi:cobalt-zinc-cadmium efflux system membrane fusion protein